MTDPPDMRPNLSEEIDPREYQQAFDEERWWYEQDQQRIARDTKEQEQQCQDSEKHAANRQP